MKPSLLFVYNAESGLFNTLTDIAHKIFSPRTYSCNLCALTHSNLGMRREWKEFIEGLDRPVEFLHADESRARHDTGALPLPVVLTKAGEGLEVLVDAETINACRSIEDLKRVILGKL